jgi:uncharacterized protein (DUF433 family)
LDDYKIINNKISKMLEVVKYTPVVQRADRGLTIAGTRITLYQIMDSLKAGYPPEEVRDDFGLTLLKSNLFV